MKKVLGLGLILISLLIIGCGGEEPAIPSEHKEGLIGEATKFNMNAELLEEGYTFTTYLHMNWPLSDTPVEKAFSSLDVHRVYDKTTKKHWAPASSPLWETRWAKTFTKKGFDTVKEGHKYYINIGKGNEGTLISPFEKKAVTLSLGKTTDTTVDIMMSNTERVGGFQFALTGVSLTSASGGAAGDDGIYPTAKGNAVVAASMGGSIPSGGERVLTTLTFSSDSTEICFKEGTVVFATDGGVELPIAINYECVSVE